MELATRSTVFGELIEARAPPERVPVVEEGVEEGRTKFARAECLQDLGDELRKAFGPHAVAALAVKEVIKRRGAIDHGAQKIAFILDSLKHSDEVHLLRRVYDLTFRLVAVHSERTRRESRLIGDNTSAAKYKGVAEAKVLAYMERDEKDKDKKFGQQVRDAFYLADYFIDNNVPSQDGLRLNYDLQRFIDLLLGKNLVRPTRAERGMFHAHAAALQSACLSRQVGAALVSADGRVVATGSNDVPQFGGGTYSEDSRPDHRCHVWEFKDNEVVFKGCHNTRRKGRLREEITKWLAEKLSGSLAEAAHPIPKGGMDTAKEARGKAELAIRTRILNNSSLMEDMPGIKDLIEYSRSIHAEMSAVLNAARAGVSPADCTLYCTTFPCHSCARHLVNAGIKDVYYIEPYVKSLATELHSDSIQAEAPPVDPPAIAKAVKMVILPFTGIGPRMYEDYFVKRGDLKNDSGVYTAPAGELPSYAVRLREAAQVEAAAANLVGE